ncbi:DUF1365 domain-containing protein [Marinobacterium jannaschii]|uniref:DUF1365 domain-containing protein n=1 Tax=Marinobacterium jannaschii TaxID=64970 RepID=UPI000687E6BC|nr:DUF1365 domain-containing protein [Marinobacterium jannaschii]
MAQFLSRIYTGSVMHHRYRPRQHRFIYRVFSLCVDIDELPQLHQRLRLFGHNRRNLFAFYDRDYGNGQEGGLRDHAETLLRKNGLQQFSQRIELLCYPRILGYVFNPLSVWFCYDQQNRPGAIIYEVSNTFGERHSYVLPAELTETEDNPPLRQRCDKAMYVSPFIGMQCDYSFQIRPPAEQVAIRIHQSEHNQPLLLASFSGTQQPLSDRQLIRLFLRYPLMTLKVIAAIHWEALRLWLKKTPLQPRPDADHPAAPSGDAHDEAR